MHFTFILKDLKFKVNSDNNNNTLTVGGSIIQITLLTELNKYLKYGLPKIDKFHKK